MGTNIIHDSVGVDLDQNEWETTLHTVSGDTGWEGFGITNIDQITPVVTTSLQILTVTGAVGVDIISTQDGSTGAYLTLQQVSASPATWDSVGRIEFKGRDSGAGTDTYASIRGYIYDATAGDEDGIFDVWCMQSGVLANVARFGGAGTTYLYTTVGGGGLNITSTQDGATGAYISLHQNSASPAVSDVIGAILFQGEDDGSNKTTYATIRVLIGDETGGTEDGQIDFRVIENAVDTRKLIIKGSSQTILYADGSELGLKIQNNYDGNTGACLHLFTNSDSPANGDICGWVQFRGEDSDSNETVYCYIAGVIDNVTSGSEDGEFQVRVIEGGSAGTTKMILEGSGENYLYNNQEGKGLYITSTNDGTFGARLTLFHDSASPAYNDTVAEIYFRGRDDGTNGTIYARLQCIIEDETGGTEDGKVQFSVLEDGSNTIKLVLTGSGENYLYTTVAGTGLYITCTEDGASGGAELQLYQDSASPADWDVIGSLWFTANNSVDALQFYGGIRCQIVDVTDATEDSKMLFKIMRGGAEITAMTLDYDTNRLYSSSSNSGLRIQDATDGSAGALIDIYTDSASPAASDVVAKIRMAGENDAAEEIQYGHIDTQIRVVTDGSEQSRMRFYIMDGGVDTEMLQLDGTNGVYINADGDMELISVGANDSGGAGYKYLRIPN